MSAPTWQHYVDQILHKLDHNKNEWKKTDICSAAAIYGLDGYPWAFSPNFPELKLYKHPLEALDGSVTDVEVDEVDIAVQAGKGVRNPNEAGIRLGGQKYMFVAHDSGDMTTQLSKRGGGGGAIAITKKACIVAFYEKEL